MRKRLGGRWGVGGKALHLYVLVGIIGVRVVESD